MTATPPPPGEQQPVPQQGWQPQGSPADLGQGGWPQPQQQGSQAPQQSWQAPQQVWQAAQQGWQGTQQTWQGAQQTWQGAQQHGWPDPQQGAQQPQQQYALVGAATTGGAAPPAGYGYAQPQPSEFGYGYGPMPQYPPPQFPPPRQPPTRGVPAWVWVIASVLVIAVVTVFALPAIVDDPGDPVTAGPTADPTDGFGQPNTSSSGTFTGEHMITTINAALAAKDREAFFRFVEGDALAPLTLWWDNMEVLQWSAGALSVAPGQVDTYTDDTITLRFTLGAATAGSPNIPPESDHPDAGLSYAPSNIYQATVRVTDDGASGIITGWRVEGTAAPWDLEPLYAVVTEHSVMAGYVDERELVDRIAPLGDVGAAWVIETYQNETGVANAQRFTTFVTEDSARFNEWFIDDTSGWVADRAGTMFPQRRPYPTEGIAASIAVGGSRTNAGGILTVGPNGLLYGAEDTQDTIVHEFIHAMHTTNVPEESWPGSPVMEGWAVYNESLFRGDGEFAALGTYIGRSVRMCLDSDDYDGSFPTQSDFVEVETVQCAYMLSGSMYAYAESLGVDVFEAADHALEEGLSLPDTVAALGGPVIDEAGWDAWLQANYG